MVGRYDDCVELISKPGFITTLSGSRVPLSYAELTGAKDVLYDFKTIEVQVMKLEPWSVPTAATGEGSQEGYYSLGNIATQLRLEGC